MTEFCGPDPEFLALVPVLNLLGAVLKHSRWVADEKIPLLLSGAGAALATAACLARLEEPTPAGVAAALYRGVTQGLLAAGAGVYLHQLKHQWEKAAAGRTTRNDLHGGGGCRILKARNKRRGNG